MLKMNSMKKCLPFFSSGLALMVVLLLVLAGQAGTASGPAIAITPDDYDTGDITRITKPFSKVFTVANNGSSLLSIAKIKYT
jgi:hypothetical protein